MYVRTYLHVFLILSNVCAQEAAEQRKLLTTQANDQLLEQDDEIKKLNEVCMFIYIDSMDMLSFLVHSLSSTPSVMPSGTHNYLRKMKSAKRWKMNKYGSCVAIVYYNILTYDEYIQYAYGGHLLIVIKSEVN